MSMNKGTYNISSMRLSHVPTVWTCGKQFALWTDVKELLLWCADTQCCVVLEALDHLHIQSFVHPCSKQEQQDFSMQFVCVKPGTCLVNIEILKNLDVLSFLHSNVKQKHLESKYPEVCHCVRILRELSAKYTNTIFKIPMRMASNMKLLPAFRRSLQIWNHDSSRETHCDENNSTISKTIQPINVAPEISTSTLVPMGLLADMYPECVGFLHEAATLYIKGLCRPGRHSSVYECTVEEGILLTRFVSSYRGYDSHWSCFTSNSLLMSWTEFWNRQDSSTRNKLYPKLSNTGMIILNCQTIPDTVTQNTTSAIDLSAHPVVLNEGARNIVNHRNEPVNEGKTDDHGMINGLYDIQPIIPQNLQLGNKENPEIYGDVQMNANKAKNITENETNISKSRLIRQGNKIDESTVPCRGRKLISCNGMVNQSFKKGINDKDMKDKNNSATKKGIGGVLRPGSGDTTEMDVNFKAHAGKEILSVKKLTISKTSSTNTRMLQGVEAETDMVQTEKKAEGKYKHIFVPVCDNDHKAECSMTEVSGYELTSLATEEIEQEIHVSITPKKDTSNGDQRKQMGLTSLFPDTHVTKRKDDGERKCLKLSTAYIHDDMPVARLEGKIPPIFAAKYGLTNDDSDACKRPDVNVSVKESDDTDLISSDPQYCDNFDDNDKPKYISVTPKQLELTTSMLKGKDLDPNVIQENRRFPYKPVRNDNKQLRGSPVIQCQNLMQDVTSSKAVPVIKGTQISVKSAGEKVSLTDKPFFHPLKSISAPSIDPTLRKSSTNDHNGFPEKKFNVMQNHVVSVLTCQNNEEHVTSDHFVATGKMIKTFERTTDFNSSEFMKERITMWRDSVEQALHPNKAERLTKSADIRRNRQACTYRPSSSIYFSPETNFEREKEISPSMCSALSKENYLNNQSDNDGKINYREPVQQKHHVEVQNYGSSSSTTPDIYDEFARKRRPKQIKPDTVQIKPKPVTRPVPTTLCQTIVRKAPPQTVAPKPSSQSYNTAGYNVSNAGRSKLQTSLLANKTEDVKPCLKQTFHHSDNTSTNNVYHDSKTLELQFLASSGANTNSNTSCSYSACSLNKKDMTRKIPSAKEGRKPFVPEFCTFVERPPTAKSSSTVDSNSIVLSKFDTKESDSKSCHLDKAANSVNTSVNKETIIGKMNVPNGGTTRTVTGCVEQKKSHLLEKVTSFVESYVSPKKSESLEDINSIHAILSTNPLQGMSLGEIDEDVTNKSNDNKSISSNKYKHRETIPDLECYKYLSLKEAERDDKVLSKVDSQLYYKVPEDEHYHRVTGNMVIPPHAQFFIQSRGTSEESLSVNSCEKLATESKTEDTNQLKNKSVDSLKANGKQISSLFSSQQNSDAGIMMGKGNAHDSILDMILMTSYSFKDKAEQMKHIILETEQAIQKADEQEDDEELTGVRKVNNEEIITSTELQKDENDNKDFKTDPPKVISPTPGLELTKKIVNKKKSFKEAVEEKRAQKKKTEKELSKKRYWNSAHLKIDKTEQISDKSGKNKPKPSLKENRSNVNTRVYSGSLNIQQKNASSKSGINENCGKKVDDRTIKKKTTTSGQRPKTTEMKTTVKERHVKSYPNVISSETHRGKPASNAQNNPVKSSINSNIKKQRVSKSAPQFPKNYSQLSQENSGVDDCTTKILTALRRLSIEKSPNETEIKISPKLDARQRKLRSCVVKKLIGQKCCSDYKPEVEKETTERAVKHNNVNEVVANDLKLQYLSDESKSSTSQKISTNKKEQALLSNFTRECYVSLKKLNANDSTRRENCGLGENHHNADSSKYEKTKSNSSILHCGQNYEGSADEHRLEERTFITKFNVNEINNEYGVNLVEDERTGTNDWTLNGGADNDFLTNANVNCKIIEAELVTGFAGTSADVCTNDENHVQIYLNDSTEKYALPQTEVMYMYSKSDNSNGVSPIRIERSATAETVYAENIKTPNAKHTSNEYVGINLTEDCETKYNDNVGRQETLLYAEECDNIAELHGQFTWNPNEPYAYDISTSDVELICLDNKLYHPNGAKVCDNLVLLSQNIEGEKGFPICEQQMTDKNLSQKYLGLQIAWNSSEHMLDRVNATRTTASDAENGNIEFIDETECGEEVYIETADTDVQVSSPTENVTPEILHNDVFMNKNDDFDVGKSQSDIPDAGTGIEECSSAHYEDKSTIGKSSKLDRNDNFILLVDKEKCLPSPAHFIGDTSIYSGKLSPSESEMEVYFAKVAERAGLNPFLDSCLDDMTEKGADIHKSCDYTNDKLDSKVKKKYCDKFQEKDMQANCDNEMKDAADSNCGDTDNELDAFVNKSDVADMDYDPDVDSCSDTDIEDSTNEGVAEDPISVAVKTKSKHKKNSKKADQKIKSKNKLIKVKEVLSNEEMWKKYLKDSYACDNRAGKTKKCLKQGRKLEDESKLSKLQSSIVRDYCLKHVESEETLAQLKSKLWKDKYLANEIESSKDKHYKDPSGNFRVESTHKKPTKQYRKKLRGRKSGKSTVAEKLDTDEEKMKEKEEVKAAEGFIKTQKLYFNILKKMSIDNCKHDIQEDHSELSNTYVEELPEVIEAVAVHGERCITKAESDAEKALEGTGSLDNILAEDEGTIIEDLTNQCRYQMIEDEDHVQLGGIAYFKDFQLPFVYINGYKYTPVKDAVRLFQSHCCISKCTIPRNVLQKYKTLVKSFSTWEQVYKLELIKLKKGPMVTTGDMLVKLESLLSLLPDLINTIMQQHKDTKLKNSQSCLMEEYKKLLDSLK